MRRASSLCLLGMLIGCAPPLAGVKLKAAATLTCAGEVEVRWVADLDYDAIGCGRAVTLRCPPSDSGANCRVIAAESAHGQVTVIAPTGAMWATTPQPVTSSSPPGGIYAPGQYNPRTGAVQTDYAHQFTRPSVAPTFRPIAPAASSSPAYHPYTPPPAYHPYTPPPIVHH